MKINWGMAKIQSEVVVHLCVYFCVWACMYLNFFGSKEIYIFDINYNIRLFIRLDFKGMFWCFGRSFSLSRLIEAEQNIVKIILIH